MEAWTKALASYNYMKLMVSELRRQLDEIIELEKAHAVFIFDDQVKKSDTTAISGNFCPKPGGVRFYGSDMLVKFHTDDTHAGKGFQIMVRQKSDCSQYASTRIIPYAMDEQNYCDEELCSQEFYLQSPNFPTYYKNFMDCAYVIHKFSPSVCELQLTFLSFDLQQDSNCNYDYLEIDGQRYCGSAHHGSVKRLTFDKPEVVIRFHSDGSSTGRGYQIFAQQRRDCAPSYRVIPDFSVAVPRPQPLPLPPSCDAKFSSTEFRVRSLNYPSNYDNNLNCVLRIQKAYPDVCELHLIFNSFDVEDDPGCRYDYLEVGGQRLCGFVRQGTVKNVLFDGKETLLSFHSDHSNSRPGFDITILQKTDCATAPPPTLPPPLLILSTPQVQLRLPPTPQLQLHSLPAPQVQLHTMPVPQVQLHHVVVETVEPDHVGLLHHG